MLAFFIIVKKKKKKKAIVFAKSFVPCNRLCHAISTAAYEHLEFSDSCLLPYLLPRCLQDATTPLKYWIQPFTENGPSNTLNPQCMFMVIKLGSKMP